jgi:hypothetical protein
MVLLITPPGLPKIFALPYAYFYETNEPFVLLMTIIAAPHRAERKTMLPK